MSTYTARFSTTISLVVTVEADDEDAAAEIAWEDAKTYLDTVYGHRNVIADATLDGIGADKVEEQDTPEETR